MKNFIKIAKIILNTIMIIISILGVLFVGLYIYGIQPYVVESGSMEPAIQTGSLSFISKKVSYEQINIGDIIAFKVDSGAYATHRVINITEKGFTTKGDSNKPIDNIITTKENYIGKNIFSIPKVGIAVKAIQSPRGKIIFGTIILFLFLAGILIGEPSKRYKNKENNKENVK